MMGFNLTGAMNTVLEAWMLATSHVVYHYTFCVVYLATYIHVLYKKNIHTGLNEGKGIETKQKYTKESNPTQRNQDKTPFF